MLETVKRAAAYIPITSPAAMRPITIRYLPCILICNDRPSSSLRLGLCEARLLNLSVSSPRDRIFGSTDGYLLRYWDAWKVGGPESAMIPSLEIEIVQPPFSPLFRQSGTRVPGSVPEEPGVGFELAV